MSKKEEGWAFVPRKRSVHWLRDGQTLCGIWAYDASTSALAERAGIRCRQCERKLAWEGRW
ncbi:MAG: hypothetical protein KGL39_36830 [Patescibacteria group bacterium]|nr:hypothetical protein [Patescibacteria group bacterium]